jgi:hypothetical protein
LFTWRSWRSACFGGLSPLGPLRYSAALLALVSVFAGVVVGVVGVEVVVELDDDDSLLEDDEVDDEELLLLLPYPSEYQPPPFKMKLPLTI